MICKSDFVQYVQQEWIKYLTVVGDKIANQFLYFDSLHKRGGLNLEQLTQMLASENLGISPQELTSLKGVVEKCDTSLRS